MKYNFSEEINKMLKELESSIMDEFDSSPEIGVRVNLLPKAHNTMSQYEHIVNNSEVIQRMHEKLEELKLDYEGCTSRLDSAKTEGREEDVEVESKLAEEISISVLIFSERILLLSDITFDINVFRDSKLLSIIDI